MIDNTTVERMAREYQINPSLARRLLEKADAQPAPALLRCREYREVAPGAGKIRRTYDTRIFL